MQVFDNKQLTSGNINNYGLYLPSNATFEFLAASCSTRIELNNDIGARRNLIQTLPMYMSKLFVLLSMLICFVQNS